MGLNKKWQTLKTVYLQYTYDSPDDRHAYLGLTCRYKFTNNKLPGNRCKPLEINFMI